MEEDLGVRLGNVESETPLWKFQGRACTDVNTWNPEERAGRDTHHVEAKAQVNST